MTLPASLPPAGMPVLGDVAGAAEDNAWLPELLSRASQGRTDSRHTILS